MRYTSLHTIISGLLAQRRYPIHFYMDFLIYAIRVFEELHFDVLGNVRIVKIDRDGDDEFKLPDDYMDEVSVGVPAGQSIRPFVHRRMNPLLEDNEGGSDAGYYGIGDAVFFNSKGELTGRFYGLRGIPRESYEIDKKKGIIRVDKRACVDSVILTYISDGTEIDNATQINPYAKQTIEDGILWKYYEHRRSSSPSQISKAESKFIRSRKILKGRLNPLTVQGVRSAIYKNSTGAPR